MLVPLPCTVSAAVAALQLRTPGAWLDRWAARFPFLSPLIVLILHETYDHLQEHLVLIRSSFMLKLFQLESNACSSGLHSSSSAAEGTSRILAGWLYRCRCHLKQPTECLQLILTFFLSPNHCSLRIFLMLPFNHTLGCLGPLQQPLRQYTSATSACFAF